VFVIKSRKNEVRDEKAAVPSILIAMILLAVAVVAQAQPQAKIPRIGYISGTGDSVNQGPTSRHCAKGCVISVMSKGKTSGSSIAVSRENLIGSRR
jgi:hypothetical protein